MKLRHIVHTCGLLTLVVVTDILPCANSQVQELKSAMSQQIPVGQIVYVENDDIWLYDFDNGQSVNLTNHPAADMDPTWSPDGRQIAFISTRGIQTNLYVLDVASNTIRQLTGQTLGLRESPAWSPDGQWIAFSEHFYIVVVPSGGGLPQYDGDVGELITDLTWSPNGDWIGFSALIWDDGSWHMGVVKTADWSTDLFGLDPLEANECKSLNYKEARWSPDGKKIAFVATLGEQNSRSNGEITTSDDDVQQDVLCVMNADRRGTRLVATDAGSPSWSPDGQWLVFEGRGKHEGLWIVKAEGGELRQIKSSGGSPAWRPDLTQAPFLLGPEFNALEPAVLTCRDIGDARRDSGDYKDALINYSCAMDAGEQMATLWQSGRVPIETHFRFFVNFANLADICASMADIYLQLGDPAQAVESINKARAFAERAAQVGSGLNKQMEAASLVVWLLQTINAARVNLEAGRHEEALRLLEQAEEIETLVPDDENILGEKLAYEWLAALWAFGASDLAKGYLKGAGRLDLYKGQVYLGLSEYEKARQSLSLALREYYRYYPPEQVGVFTADMPGMAMAANGLGFIYYHMGKYEDATRFFDDALQFAIEAHNISQQYSALFGGGLVLEAMGKPEQALQRYQSAATILESIRERIGAEAYVISFTAEASWIYERIVAILTQQKDYENAFNYTERAKARVLLDLLGNQRINPKGSENPQLIERERKLQAELAAIEGKISAEWAKPAHKRDSQAIENLIANLETKRQEYNELITQLQLTNPEYAALMSMNPLTLNETQAWLRDEAPHTGLVEYFVGDKETVIFVVTPDVFYTEVVSVTRQELRRQLEALLVQMKAETLLPEAWQDPAQTLYGWLIAPVREYLPSSDPAHPPLLGIIPHGVLHYLPFSLLTDTGHALIRDYTLFYAPSASSLHLILDKRKSGAGALLALANPGVEGQPYLRYAVDEAKAVAKLYGVQPLIDKEATEDLFKAQAGDYGLIHIAAHSDYNARAPLFSAILLQSDGTEDGRLETHEILNLDLRQTDLVTLSACQTHLGELSAGDELVGLERAFFRAGAASLVTSLWPVDDASTATLMERFYIYLRAGMPKAEALRLAQLETREEYAEPYYWAPFLLVGAPDLLGEGMMTPQPSLREAAATPQATPSGSGAPAWPCWGGATVMTAAMILGSWQIGRRKRQK